MTAEREITYDSLIGYPACPACGTSVITFAGDTGTMTFAEIGADAEEQLRCQCPAHEPVKVGTGGQLRAAYTVP